MRASNGKLLGKMMVNPIAGIRRLKWDTWLGFRECSEYIRREGIIGGHMGMKCMK